MSRHTELAHAKVNLVLRILSRERDGYHQLQTIFQALALHDTLEAEPAPTMSLHVEGDVDVGPPEHNLVMRAARAFRDEVPDAPTVAFHLTKRIPSAAGLGGGSSDAAAALRALNRISGEPLDRDALSAIAVRLGADVPFFLCGSPLATASGIGERLTPLEPLPSAAVVVVDPRVDVPTRTAFAWWDAAHPHSIPAARMPATIESFADARAWASNDFEEVLFPRHPQLGRIRDALQQAGATLALMSGSGSCVFGIFAERAPASALTASIHDVAPAARVLHTRTLA